MRWFLIQAILQVIALIHGTVSSLVASVIFHRYSVPLIASAEAIEQFVLRVWSIGESYLTRIAVNIIERTRLKVSGWRLSMRALVESRETIVLATWGLVSILSLPVLLTVLNYPGISRSSDVTSSGFGVWSYTISKGSAANNLRLGINRAGIELFSTNIRSATLITFDADGSSHEISLSDDSDLFCNLNTRDISGDHIPDLLLRENYMGSVGSNHYQLLSLGREVRQEFTTTSASEWTFKDLDGDKRPEFVAKARIRADRLDSVDPIIPVDVILKYDGKLRLMLTRPPNHQEFQAKLDEDKRLYDLRESGPDYPYMARLVFGGNAQTAYAYLTSIVGRSALLRWHEFYWAIRESEYGSDVELVNALRETLDSMPCSFCRIPGSAGAV